jgi:hypothetical protein
MFSGPSRSAWAEQFEVATEAARRGSGGKVYDLLRLKCAAKAACQSLTIVSISSSFAACQ